jgi:hypothetical protein
MPWAYPTRLLGLCPSTRLPTYRRLARPVAALGRTNSPARLGDLHCNCTVHALNVHYRSMGNGPYSRWNTDMTYANSIQRQELITGLRALADFLESNPEVPAPSFTDMLVSPPRADDSENRREIDSIASRIGAGTGLSYSGRHYLASRRFGPVQYRAVAIPADETKEPRQ